MLVGLFAWGATAGGSTYAAEQELHSHSITSFYGVYEEPQNGGSDHSNENGGGSTTPNYSASGHEIIPDAGDQDFTMVQASGSALLLTVVTFLWIQKRKGENF